MTMTPNDRESLKGAVRALEASNLAIRTANYLGKPVEIGLEKLPEAVREKVQGITEKAMDGALRAALTSLSDPTVKAPSNRGHKFAVALSGAVGGAFGIPALAAELPLSTTIMLRSIADIARSEGEDLSQREAQLACLQVFALGGHDDADDAAETGYFAVRQGLYFFTKEAAEYVARKGVEKKTAPALARLIAKVAERFGITVSEKVIAQSLPVIGAVGGGAINLVFIAHFQDVARGHFTVRRLERIYGADLVREEYRRIKITGEAFLD